MGYSDALVSVGIWVDGETKLHCNSPPDLNNQGTRPVRRFAGFYNLISCQAVV